MEVRKEEGEALAGRTKSGFNSIFFFLSQLSCVSYREKKNAIRHAIEIVVW